MSKLAIVDGDSLVYRAALSQEKTKYAVEVDGVLCSCKDWVDAIEVKGNCGGEIWNRTEIGKPEEATDKFDELMIRVNSHVKPDTVALYLTGLGPSFRDAIARTKKYKGQRDRPRPSLLYDVRDFAVAKYGAQVEHNEEADDLVSCAAYEARAKGVGYVVVGQDKDLDQIPGSHYDWVANVFYDVSDSDARAWFWLQVLAGDPTDNIAGCWKTGPQKAINRVRKWIEKEQLPDWRIWDETVELYRESQKLEGCPYKNFDAVDVVEETIGLVRLKTTKEESPWTRTTITTGREIVSHGRETQGKGTSECAPSATESAQRSGGPASGRTIPAQSATV